MHTPHDFGDDWIFGEIPELPYVTPIQYWTEKTLTLSGWEQNNQADTATVWIKGTPWHDENIYQARTMSVLSQNFNTKKWAQNPHWIQKGQKNVVSLRPRKKRSEIWFSQEEKDIVLAWLNNGTLFPNARESAILSKLILWKDVFPIDQRQEIYPLITVTRERVVRLDGWPGRWQQDPMIIDASESLARITRDNEWFREMIKWRFEYYLGIKNPPEKYMEFFFTSFGILDRLLDEAETHFMTLPYGSDIVHPREKFLKSVAHATLKENYNKKSATSFNLYLKEFPKLREFLIDPNVFPHTPSHITLEVLEGQKLDPEDELWVIAAIRDLQLRGYKISIDDYGKWENNYSEWIKNFFIRHDIHIDEIKVNGDHVLEILDQIKKWSMTVENIRFIDVLLSDAVVQWTQILFEYLRSGWDAYLLSEYIEKRLYNTIYPPIDTNPYGRRFQYRFQWRWIQDASIFAREAKQAKKTREMEKKEKK